MSAALLTQLERLYQAIQHRYPVMQGSPELAEAVQFRSNRTRPVHRWFHLKEGFAASLLFAIGIETRELYREEAIFLDPFCGCGTTLIAGDIEHRWRARRIGVEINPFLAFVAKVQTSPTQSAYIRGAGCSAPRGPRLSILADSFHIP
jgi:hypothetical protein